MSAEYNAKFTNTDIATRAIHAGQEPDPTTGAVVTPISSRRWIVSDRTDGTGGTVLTVPPRLSADSLSIGTYKKPRPTRVGDFSLSIKHGLNQLALPPCHPVASAPAGRNA